MGALLGTVTEKEKNIHENKSANQIDLFVDDEKEDLHLLSNTKDWEALKNQRLLANNILFCSCI